MDGSRKVVVLGSAACGKTALVNRAINNTFSQDYSATFGADLSVKAGNPSIQQPTLSIWSCSGHMRYRALLDQFISSANVAILCFDLLKQSSFLEVPYWFNELKRLAPDARIVLVGTKSDHSDDVAIQPADAHKQAKEWGIEYRAVSSKTGLNVNELFQML